MLPTASARKREPAAKATGPSAEAMKIARQYDRLTAAGKQRYRLLMVVAQDGVNPTEIEPAPGRPSSKTSHESALGADSGLGELIDIPRAHEPQLKRDK